MTLHAGELFFSAEVEMSVSIFCRRFYTIASVRYERDGQRREECVEGGTREEWMTYYFQANDVLHSGPANVPYAY